jgi:hypothetical protein
MNNLSYRVYSSYQGWKLIGIKQEILQVIELIGNKIKEEVNAQYLIIEHDRTLNADIPFKTIYGIEDLLIFTEEYKEENNISNQKRIKR